ncbi:MAG: hypothetical protein ACRDYU_12665 [Actinomycetes bacterium]
MGIGVLPRSVNEDARSRARSRRGGAWPVLADRVRQAATEQRRRSRAAYLLLAGLVALMVWQASDLGEAFGEPAAGPVGIFVVGVLGVAGVKLHERLRARQRLVTVLWEALCWSCVPIGRVPAVRVEPEVSGRLVYASYLARQHLAATAGSSAYGGADSPRRKAGYVADRLREAAEWPFRHTDGHGHPEWREEIQAELIGWISVLHDGTWYRRVPDDRRERFDDLTDLRVAGILLACVLVGIGTVLDRGPTPDMTGEVAAVLAVLLLVGRPVFCALEAAAVIMRGMFSQVVDR